MPLILYGLNHKTAPISVRESFAQLNKQKLPMVDGRLLEAVSLFTCNRAEIYFCGGKNEAQLSFELLLSSKNIHFKDLCDYLYIKTDYDVFSHLFRVAAGLDSMVIGENQILHQIKSAYKVSSQCKYVGSNLHRLFQKTLEAGKKVRAKTKISANNVSIASTAVCLIKKTFTELVNPSALVIGAGEMADLVAVHLQKAGVERLFYINRTFETALELANKYNGTAVPFDQLKTTLAEVDVVISSTSAPSHVIDTETMKSVMRLRKNRHVFIVDIAMPRDVAPDCAYIDNLYLYDIDDLQTVVNENLSNRMAEAVKAERIIEHEIREFNIEIQNDSVVPLIKDLRSEAEKIRHSELNYFFEQYPDMSPEMKSSFEESTRVLMSRWLHKQIIGIKSQEISQETKKDRIVKLRSVLGAVKKNYIKRKEVPL